MNTQTAKSKIKNISGCQDFTIFNNGDHRSFTVNCNTSDALKIAFAIHKAGWKRTENSPTQNGKSIVCFEV